MKLSKLLKLEFSNVFTQVLNSNGKVEDMGIWMENAWSWNIGLRDPVICLWNLLPLNCLFC